MSKRRVVVTGLGIVSPLGSAVEPVWQAVLAGRSGITPITTFDASMFNTRFAGAVQGFTVTDYLSPKEARRMDPFMHYGMGAGVQAMTDSGLDLAKADLERFGAVMGSGIGGLAGIEAEVTTWNETRNALNPCSRRSTGLWRSNWNCGPKATLSQSLARRTSLPGAV